MGGHSFFTNLGSWMDPVQQFAGKNSWASRMASYDPLMSSSVGKYIDPAAAQNGQAYANRNNVSGYPNPTPYAGVTPTLQDANNGYVQAAQKVTQQQQQQRQQSPYQGA
jgi:hypothetical protein